MVVAHFPYDGVSDYCDLHHPTSSMSSVHSFDPLQHLTPTRTANSGQWLDNYSCAWP